MVTDFQRLADKYKLAPHLAIQSISKVLKYDEVRSSREKQSQQSIIIKTEEMAKSESKATKP